MPLSAPKSPRQPLHHRQISVRGYRRDDGMFDIEGHLHDSKDYDFKLASGFKKAGDPVHSMWLRITIDRTMTIVDAEACTDSAPYMGYCETINSKYQQLVGMAIRPGFSYRIKELYAGTKGCTHITDLIGTVATTAFQSMAGQGVANPDKQPFQLDRCHALASNSGAVARFYPRWYKGVPTGADADPAETENH